MLKSMRVRLSVSFIVLLVIFGWMLSRAIAHTTELLKHYDMVAQQHHIRVVLTTFMWVLFPLAAIGAWALVGGALKPLRALSRQAENPKGSRLVAPSTLPLIHIRRNRLSRQRSPRWAPAHAKTSFYAATSHELRTPLQALSGHIDLALSKPRTNDELKRALLEAQKQTQRLTSLTNDILTLHQLQSQTPDSTETADLHASVQRTVAELTPLAELNHIKIKTQLEPVSTHGRQSYADICIRNLVENAARYGTPNSEIHIKLTTLELVVHNAYTGDPIPFAALLEPFAASKGVAPSTRGNGLGLAICQAAATANGWTLSATQDPTGVTIRIRPTMD